MPENIKEIVYLLVAIPMLGVFAHIVAYLALLPILYFFWSPHSKSRRWLTLILLTPILWSMMFYGSYLGGQFLQSPSSIGLLLAAGISIVLMSWGIRKNWFEKREWIGVVMLFGFPAIGYFIGLVLGA